MSLSLFSKKKISTLFFVATTFLVLSIGSVTAGTLPSLSCSKIVPTATSVNITIKRDGTTASSLDLQLNLKTGSKDLVYPAYIPSGLSEKEFTFSGLTANKLYSVFAKESGPFTTYTKLACDFTSKVGGPTNTTTISSPITAITTSSLTDKTVEVSVTYDIYAGPGVDSVSAVVRGSVVGMGGGGYVHDLGSYDPSSGRLTNGKKSHGFPVINDLVANTKYTITVTAKYGADIKYTKSQEFTTKKVAATTSPIGSNPTTDPVNPNNPTTGNPGSGTGAGTGTQYEVGANASTGTAPGGLVGCEGAGCSFQDLLELIKKGYSFVIKLIIPIFAIIIAYVGFLFITSGGNTEVRARAKGILTKALIGLVLILCAGLIVGLIYKAFGVKSCYNWIGKEIKDCTAQTTSQHNTWMV